MSAKTTLLLFLPLLLIPTTLFIVKNTGHENATALIGLSALYVFAFHADTQTRRLMIALAILSQLFETANLGAGLYHYTNSADVPLWISLGWGIVGWYAVSNKNVFDGFNEKKSYFLFVILLFLQAFFTKNFSIAIIIIPVGIWMLQKASGYAAALIIFVALLGMLIEFSGTSYGVWTYTINGKAISPPLPLLGLAYAAAWIFAGWVAGYKNQIVVVNSQAGKK